MLGVVDGVDGVWFSDVCVCLNEVVGVWVKIL